MPYWGMDPDSATNSDSLRIMTELLFVCTSNKFRSPLAAAYFLKKIKENSSFIKNPEENWHVSSAGTWTEEGQPVAPYLLERAYEMGLDLSAHRTREVTAEMLSAADLIFVMEKNHREMLIIEFPESAKKIFLLGELSDPRFPEIPDPAFLNLKDSEGVIQTITSDIDHNFLKIIRMAEERPFHHADAKIIQLEN